MKILTQKISLLALVLVVMGSCKQKVDMEFVNSLVSSQSKITEMVSAIKSNDSAMSQFKETMMTKGAEMAKADPSLDVSGLVQQATSILGDRGTMLTKMSGLATTVGGLVTKYKSGGIKLKDAKGEFDGIQSTFNEYISKFGESDKQFGDVKSKFTEMVNKYKEATKK